MDGDGARGDEVCRLCRPLDAAAHAVVDVSPILQDAERSFMYIINAHLYRYPATYTDGPVQSECCSVAEPSDDAPRNSALHSLHTPALFEPTERRLTMAGRCI